MIVKTRDEVSHWDFQIQKYERERKRSDSMRRISLCEKNLGSVTTQGRGVVKSGVDGGSETCKEE